MPHPDHRRGSPRVREWALRVALVAAAFCVAVLAAEAGVRATGPAPLALHAERFWEAQSDDVVAADPEPAARLAGLQFREEPISDAPFASGVTRILFLGDSFTYGSGVPTRADRFTDRIEASLDTELERRVHVFNAGLTGTEPVRWERYQRALLPAYRPHAIFAVFFLRDGTDVSTSLRFNRELVEEIRAEWEARPLYASSALARFFYDRMAWRAFHDELLRQLTVGYLGTPRERRIWLRQQHALVEMAQRSRRHGVPFHLVVFPLLLDLDDYAFFEVEAEIETFARREGIPFFSLTAGFLGRDARDLWVGPDDQHPNAEGHRIAAESLLPYVRAALAEVQDSAETAR